MNYWELRETGEYFLQTFGEGRERVGGEGRVFIFHIIMLRIFPAAK